ncbi:MAG: hypothetical protein ACTSXQ_00275 [Alphaproteobacteria bacterium]
MKKHSIETGTDVQTNTYYDEMADRLIVERVQDIAPILKANKEKQIFHDGYTKSRDMRHVASIPLVIVEDLMKKKIWDNPAKMKTWLNDPDNRFFRTSLGRV